MALTNQDVIAISTVVIAVCALGISLWQGFVVARHNKLSSRPILEAEAKATKDAGLYIVNCGPGAAFLKSAYLTFKAARYDLMKSDQIRKLMREVLVGDQKQTYLANQASKDTVIAPAERFSVFSIDAPGSAQKSQLSDLFENCQIEITYGSIYNDIYVFKYSSEVRDVA